MNVAFFVAGAPAPQGSKRHVGGGRMVESSKHVRPWRDSVAWAAREAGAREAVGGPVVVTLAFSFARPKGHHIGGDTSRGLTKSAPSVPAVRPDVDKLARAVLDALTGVVWLDDCQVVSLRASKAYGPPGVSVLVSSPFSSPVEAPVSERGGA